ncbi:MAG: LuxR family transcriptional regulator [Alphaproteobacteria bacterium]|nr:MAG: LuxR family transcriptional regulator [Alphaproteobacteria bacterium]
MIGRLSLTSLPRRAWVLAAIIVVQALCALFFISDVAADFNDFAHFKDLHLMLEAVAALALVAGVIALTVELRQLLRRMARMDEGLRMARGRMAEVLEEFFLRWGLTAAEREVALFILKGFDNAAIAELRGTAVGTVRAQATSVYNKAGVQGRAQLVSLFVDELLGEELLPGTPADKGKGAAA